MIKIVNEANKDFSEIEKWSNQFVKDLMNDPEIKELAKLPSNEHNEEAVSLEVVKGINGEPLIAFNSYGNGGALSIIGIDENGKPYFSDNNSEKKISYDEMLSEIKDEIKEIIDFEQAYSKGREEKLANAKEKFSKMSQEEKDKIVMNYLMNN